MKYILYALFVAFLVMKLAKIGEVANWSYWWVCLPIIVAISLEIIGWICAVIIIARKERAKKIFDAKYPSKWQQRIEEMQAAQRERMNNR